MTEKADYDHPNERIFIQTCHEAWRRRAGQFGEQVKQSGGSFTRKYQSEYEKLRVALAHSKNATTLRAVLTDFWSRARSLPSLQEGGWSAILPLLDDSQWHKARDLALLALASYQTSDTEEKKALTVNTTDDEGKEP